MNHDEAVKLAFEEAAPEGSIVTNWILVMESTDGITSELHVAFTEGMTPWMAYGMLTAAGHVVSSQRFEDD